MRLAIISDTHLPRGGRVIPVTCLEQCRRADAILHAGDFIDVAAVESIRSLGPPVHAVYGNICRPEVQEMLPERLEVELGGARIGMVHIPGPSKGRAARLGRWFPDCDLIVFGHTHMPEHEQLPSGAQIFNPGSPTERRRAPVHTMGIATITDGVVDLELADLG
ncbi:MAG: metallophosphoesterase family protein [Solirubrobacteraceae bacterium]|nr:metallophosphoesterase family protein [Solirubrobacteraceae bacterium]